jgi:hypothetical protein
MGSIGGDEQFCSSSRRWWRTEPGTDLVNATYEEQAAAMGLVGRVSAFGRQDEAVRRMGAGRVQPSTASLSLIMLLGKPSPKMLDTSSLLLCPHIAQYRPPPPRTGSAGG